MMRFKTAFAGWLAMGFLGGLAAQGPSVAGADPGQFDEVQYWVGHGTNRAAVVIDFHDGKVAHSYGWGLRWDGVMNGEDALRSIVQADPRLEWNTQEFSFGLAVYGMYFDANGNGGAFEFIGTDGGTVEDEADHLQNGFWTDGFWAYYTTEESPATHEWESSMVGAGGRILADGSWDGWSFAPGFNMNPPRNPIVFVEPPRPFLGALTLTDYTHTAPAGFTSQPLVSVEFEGAYGLDIRLSETSGGGDWIALDGEPLTFELSPGDGLKTLFATLRWGNALSDEVSGTIHLASGYNFASVALPMANPTASDHLIFDVTYESAVGGAFDAGQLAFGGTLAGIAVVDTLIDNDPEFRVIARLSDATADGSLSLKVPVYNGEGDPQAEHASAAYGVVNGGVIYARGDYNRDGVVNVEDVTALANDIVNVTVMK